LLRKQRELTERQFIFLGALLVGFLFGGRLSGEQAGTTLLGLLSTQGCGGESVGKQGHGHTTLISEKFPAIPFRKLLGKKIPSSRGFAGGAREVGARGGGTKKGAEPEGRRA
jgi:hypothetical protein